MTVPISSSRDEIRSALGREVERERWTRFDAAIRMAADDIGFIDLWPDNPGVDAPPARRLASAGCRSWSAWVSPRLQG
jgi:hypothetical protein